MKKKMRWYLNLEKNKSSFKKKSLSLGIGSGLSIRKRFILHKTSKVLNHRYNQSNFNIKYRLGLFY